MTYRVLWLCSTPLSDSDGGGSGTWLGAMARGLLAAGRVRLGIVALGDVSHFVRRDCGGAQQWLAPVRARPRGNGLPPSSLLAAIHAAHREFAPDLVHVWGTESYLGLLTARGLIAAPAILTMQGLKHRVAACYPGALTGPERLRCLGVKEIAKAVLLRHRAREYRWWGRFEREMMAGHRWVICQTRWQEAHVRSCARGSRVCHLDLPLREAFETTGAWQGHPSEARLFALTNGLPTKGIHVAVRAASALRKSFPALQLRIAGAVPGRGIGRNAYLHWVEGEIEHHDLRGHVAWLGRLSGDQIARELQSASAMVIPTFIESYCMAFAEAMRIGVPTAVAYTGGTAHLGEDEATCLFFPAGDQAACVHSLHRLLTDHSLALRLSSRARQVAAARHDRSQLAEQQADIYHRVLAEARPS